MVVNRRVSPRKACVSCHVATFSQAWNISLPSGSAASIQYRTGQVQPKDNCDVDVERVSYCFKSSVPWGRYMSELAVVLVPGLFLILGRRVLRCRKDA